MSNLLKKDTSWTINEYGQFDIKSILEEVKLYDQEWLIDTSRQDNNLTHKNTEMFQLVYSDYKWLPGEHLEIKNINKLRNFNSEKEFNEIVEFLESKFNGVLCRAEIVKMKANVKIRKHVDGGSFLQYARRCHVPIITNENVFFTVFDNTVNMKAGTLYEINNTLPHSVENNSDQDRVHLILDIMPKEML